MSNLAESHKRNLRVILDLVLNHTSDEHPWFLESKSSRDNPKADWYVWMDASPNKCFLQK
jgi:glycosidase